MNRQRKQNAVKRVLRVLVVPLFIVIFSAAMAAEPATYIEPLETAVAKLVTRSLSQWAYTRETRDEIGNYVERFDPGMPRDQQWQLLLFEGETPQKKHFKRYRREYDELFERDSPTDIDLRELIDPATVSLSRETAEMLEFSFQPVANDPDDLIVVENLRGIVQVDKHTNEVTRVTIESSGKFSPEAMVTITSMSMSLTFEAINDGGPRFIAATTSNTEGRFMGLKKFSEKEEVWFREFIESP